MCVLLLTPNCKNLIKHITVSFLKVRNGKDLIPKFFFRIFDHTILPIMNYGAEIWGGNEWSALEKLFRPMYLKKKLGRNILYYVLNISYFSHFTSNISGQQCTVLEACLA